jgi:hypothetical protein
LLDITYAEILARATDAIVGLLFKLHLKALGGTPEARLRYEDGSLKGFNDWIDADLGPFIVLETPLIASEALFRTDLEAYRAALAVFRQEQAAAAADVPHTGGAEA